jgi:hypothetical protein
MIFGLFYEVYDDLGHKNNMEIAQSMMVIHSHKQVQAKRRASTKAKLHQKLQKTSTKIPS